MNNCPETATDAAENASVLVYVNGSLAEFTAGDLGSVSSSPKCFAIIVAQMCCRCGFKREQISMPRIALFEKRML